MARNVTFATDAMPELIPHAVVAVLASLTVPGGPSADEIDARASGLRTPVLALDINALISQGP
jgi:hypothetical protein